MSTLSELEDLYRRWFLEGHDGLSYRDFVQGIRADLDALLGTAVHDNTKVNQVRYLHRPQSWDVVTICVECSDLSQSNVTYPCPTVQCLDGAS